MGEYNGVVGGVSDMVAQGFNPWWLGAKGTIDPTLIDAGTEISPRDAYKLALDWDVVTRDVLVDIGLGDEPSKLVPVENKIAVVRADTGAVLGIHSDSYGVTQNDVLVELVEAIKVVGDDVQVKSAGALFDGKVTWMLVKLGDDAAFDGGVHTQKFLLVASSHDGSQKLTARPTNVCVECMNTFDWAIGATQSVVSLRHTSNVNDRIGEAKRIIRETYNHHAAMDAEIQLLLDTPYDHADYLKHMVPAIAGAKPEDDASKRTQSLWEKRTAGLQASYNRADQQNINGTAWGAVMAVNSYELWSQTVRGSSRLERQAINAISGDFPLTQKARQLVRR